MNTINDSSLPAEPGWYVVKAAHLDGPRVRAFGRDGLWWTPLGRGDGQDGWISSPRGYEWFGPIAGLDERQPFLPDASPTTLSCVDAKDAERFRGVMDTLVAVMNEQPLTARQQKMHGMLDSMEIGTITVDHVRAAIDAAMESARDENDLQN
jgi:hypothetical protein